MRLGPPVSPSCSSRTLQDTFHPSFSLRGADHHILLKFLNLHPPSTCQRTVSPLSALLLSDLHVILGRPEPGTLFRSPYTSISAPLNIFLSNTLRILDRMHSFSERLLFLLFPGLLFLLRLSFSFSLRPLPFPLPLFFIRSLSLATRLLFI